MADKEASSPVAVADLDKSVAVTVGTIKKASGAKSKQPSAKSVHPNTAIMVTSAIKDLKERGGSSLQAIKKYMASTYKIDTEKQATFIKKYLKAAVASGVLVQTKGKGAAGSFKLSTKPHSPKSKAKKTAKTVTPKKAPAAKKPVTVKKPEAVKKVTTAKKAVATTAAVTEKKKAASKGPAAKPPKPKTTKPKPAAKSPVKKAKPAAVKKTKTAVVKTKKAPAKKTSTATKK